jgi:hypothetical protein
MDLIPYEELVIIGFDESVEAACSTSLPIVFHTPTNRYFLLSRCQPEGALPDNRFINIEDIQEGEREGLLTISPERIPAFHTALGFYVSDEFLDALNMSPDELMVEREKLKYQQINFESQHVWASFAPEDVVERQMDEWGKRLYDLATDKLVAYLSNSANESLEEAERLLDLGLDAAHDETLCYQLHVLEAVILSFSDNHTALADLCEMTSQLFPSFWDDEAFIRGMKYLTGSLIIRASKNNFQMSRVAKPEMELTSISRTPFPQYTYSPQGPPYSDPFVSSEYREPPIYPYQQKLFDEIKRISRENIETRIEQSKNYIEYYSKRLSNNNQLAAIRRAVKEQDDISHVHLPIVLITALLGEQTIYREGVVTLLGDELSIQLVALSHSIAEYGEFGIEPGPVALAIRGEK